MDIIAAEIHRVKLNEEDSAIETSHEFIKFQDEGESIGAIALTHNENIVLACTKYGVTTANFETKNFNYILKYPKHHLQLRSNDGIIDPWGHLWIGTMNDFHVGSVKPEGSLYRINCHDLSITEMLTECSIPNGLAFSSRGNKLFWTDSLTFTIWEFDYNHVTNTLSNRKEFINTNKLSELQKIKSPEPDGFTMNGKDEIYSTIYSLSKLLHFNSQGEIIEKFLIPAKNVTCATFGGRARTSLYITSAQIELNNLKGVNDKEGDLGGYLFKISCPQETCGVDKNIWGGKV